MRTMTEGLEGENGVEAVVVAEPWEGPSQGHTAV